MRTVRDWFARGGPRAAGALLLYLGLALVLSDALVGCGFHLRHPVKLPPRMDAVYLQGAPAFGDLGRDISRSLQLSGSSLTTERATATAILIIHRDQVRRRVLSVNRAGQVNEYELTYYLRFELQDPKGRVLVPAQTISLVRDYIFDPNNVLAKGNEQAQLRQEMIDFAVRQMLRRIHHGLAAGDGAGAD